MTEKRDDLDELLLTELPEAIGSTASASLPVAESVPGTVVVWITANPVEMTNARRNGYHLPKKGEGYLRNEEFFEQTPEGFLVYGDAIPAIVRADAWAAKLQRDRDGFLRELHGAESANLGAGHLVLT